MSGAWVSAVPAFLVATAVFVIPGLIVRLAGWNPRSIAPYFLAPALSTALVAVSSNVAGLIGVPWSVAPLAVLTLVAATIAYILRRWVGTETIPRPSARQIVAAAGGLALACVVLTLQLVYVFGAPGNISQTFDNIVHLNSIRLAVDSADASAFGIGRTSDIGFYPNAWHSVVTLVAQVTEIPVAVNITNIALGAVVWPASCMALAGVLFKERPAAFVGSAALSTAFGAFPILLLFFGVLYPNTMGYANIAAGVAALLLLLRARGVADLVRNAVLLVVICAGVGLGHPNAFLALFAFGAAVAATTLLIEARRARSRRAWWTFSSVVLALLLLGYLLWRFSRTGSVMSQWGPWQTGAQAFGEAILIAPRQYPVTLLTAALVLVGFVAIARRPRLIVVTMPFLVAGFLFILASGVGTDVALRNMVANPWYNDSYRLAALLPIAGIPVATMGVLFIVDSVRSLSQRWSISSRFSLPVAVVAGVALFSVGIGPNVVRMAEDARGSYAFDSGSALLTTDEAALIDRLDETTPEDALILGNPWTGTSLALALAGRDVVERHVYVARNEDEMFLDAHLRDIDSDEAVCDAVARVGVTHVLDFGATPVFNSGAAELQAGLNDLPPSPHFVLVDSEGPNARLFKIEGCVTR